MNPPQARNQKAPGFRRDTARRSVRNQDNGSLKKSLEIVPTRGFVPRLGRGKTIALRTVYGMDGLSHHTRSTQQYQLDGRGRVHCAAT